MLCVSCRVLWNMYCMLIFYQGTDDRGRGGDDESLKTGNAGARAACGVIGMRPVVLGLAMVFTQHRLGLAA